MKQQKIKLGVVCMGRKTFDYQAAIEKYEQMKRSLQDIPNVEWTIEENLIIEIEEASKVAQKFESEGLDGAILISGTFHLGHLPLLIAKKVKSPLLLWAIPELPYNGGKIRLNSLCGLNLNASNLYKSGRYDYYAHTSDQIPHDWIKAIRLKSSLEKAHIGLVGSHAHGFYNVDVDELFLYQKMGTMIHHHDLKDILQVDASSIEVKRRLDQLPEIFNCSSVTKDQTQKVARLTANFEKFMKEKGLTGIAIRCWPEFADQYGISPCAAMSILQSEGIVMGCEGDIELTLSMIAASSFDGGTPFAADLSQINFEENHALFWHCGVAPAGLWDKKSERSLDSYFAGGKGVTADFVLKEGHFTSFRIDSAGKDIRLFVGEGAALPMEKVIKGTYAKIRFKKDITDIFNTIVYNGFAHHLAMIYGQYMDALKIWSQIKEVKIYH